MPPAKPSTPFIESFDNNTRSRISWNLTEHTIDATPEQITVTIENHSISPVHLGPDAEELVIDTEPGENYVITIIASNVDGQATSPPAHLILPTEGDNSLAMQLVDEMITNQPIYS